MSIPTTYATFALPDSEIPSVEVVIRKKTSSQASVNRRIAIIATTALFIFGGLVGIFALTSPFLIECNTKDTTFLCKSHSLSIPLFFFSGGILMLGAIFSGKCGLFNRERQVRTLVNV